MYLNQNILMIILWREVRNLGADQTTQAGKLTTTTGAQYLDKENATEGLGLSQ